MVWIILLIVGCGFIFMVSRFRSSPVTKLQKEGEALGWTYVRQVRNGKYWDFLYEKNGLTALVCFENQNVVFGNEPYANFHELEKSLAIFQKVMAQQDYANFLNEVTAFVLEYSPYRFKELLKGKDKEKYDSMLNAISFHYSRGDSVEITGRHLLSIIEE